MISDLNNIGKLLCLLFGGTFLDSENILWKFHNGEWIGKRSVWTFDFRASWLEDVKSEDIKSWWCGGPDADYNEIFKDNE